MAETLQEALDYWSKNEPKLKSLSDSLTKGEFKDAVPFDVTKLHSSLPRADGSTYSKQKSNDKEASPFTTADNSSTIVKSWSPDDSATGVSVST